MPISHKDAGICTLCLSLFTKPSNKIQTIFVESLAIAFVTKVNIREYGGPFEQTHVLSIVPLQVVVKYLCLQNLFAFGFRFQFDECNLDLVLHFLGYRL